MAGFRRATRRAAWLFLLGVGGLLHAADPVPGPDGASTNSAAGTAAERTFLKNIGAQIFSTKPVVPTSPIDSLKGLPAPPLPRPVSPRVPDSEKEGDPSHSWKFAPAEEVMERYLAQEIFKLKDYGSEQEETGKDALMSQYFRQIFGRPQNSPATNRLMNPFTRGYEQTNNLYMGEYSETLIPTENERLKDLLNTGVDARQSESMVDVLRSLQASPEAARERKERHARLEEFKKLLNYDTAGPLVPNGLVKTPAEMAAEAERGTPRYFLPLPAPRAPVPAAPLTGHGAAPAPVFQGVPTLPLAPSAPPPPSLTPVLPDPAPKRIKPQPLNVTPGRRKV